MKYNKLCPKCKSENTEAVLCIPERKSTSVVAVCRDCKHNITLGDYGITTIWDK